MVLTFIVKIRYYLGTIYVKYVLSKENKLYILEVWETTMNTYYKTQPKIFFDPLPLSYQLVKVSKNITGAIILVNTVIYCTC